MEPYRRGSATHERRSAAVPAGERVTSANPPGARWADGASYSDASLYGRFAEVVATRPDHVAVTDGVATLTYLELDQLAAAYAATCTQLTGDGVTALLLDHGAALVAAALGALRAGRAIVALNHGDPPVRLAELRTAADATILLTDRHYAALGVAAGFPAARVVELAPGHQTVPSQFAASVNPGDVACLIATSGSTGRPKMVIQTHRNVLHNAWRYITGLGINQHDRIAWMVPLSGGQGLATLLSSLLSGATVCAFDFARCGFTELERWLREQQVTILDTLPSIVRPFCRALGDRRVDGVRLVRLASEAALASDLDACRRHFPPDCAVASVLASSEAGIIAQRILKPEDRPPAGRLEVGVAADGIGITLVNDAGVEARPGEVGEIVIDSDHLSPGYLGDHEHTARRFELVAGRRRLRTGDLARRSVAGSLTVVGRTDSQVKVRGHRLLPEEVESALCTQRDVAGAAVVACGGEGKAVRLVAYVVPEAGKRLDFWLLRTSLAAMLPGYAIPSTFTAVEELPLNAHGKLDRPRLAELEPLNPVIDGNSEPSTDTEELVLGLWCTAFERELAVDDGFLQAGGDSLTAAVIAAGVHELFGVEIGLEELVSNQSPSALAAVIDERRRSTERALPTINPRDRTRPARLSFHQEHLFTSAASRGAGLNIALPFRIRGALDVDALRDCFTYLIGRHEILRTTFHERQGELLQQIHPRNELDFRFDNLRGEPDPHDRATALVKRDASATFDLGARPPLSLRLMQLSEMEYQLVVVGHHILCDALSWRMLFDELAELYVAKVTGESPPLAPKLALQYADYAAWERAHLRPEAAVYEREVVWWQRVMDSPAPELRLPFERDPRQITERGPVRVTEREVSLAHAAALDRIGREAGATRFMTRLALFAALVARETGTRDLLLSTVVTGRRQPQLQRMFGPLINRSLLRLLVPNSGTFRSSLAHVRAVVLDMNATSTIDYEQLWRELSQRGIERPLRQTTVLGLHRVAPARFAGLELEPLQRWFVEPWPFQLAVETQQGGGRYRAVFDTARYDSDEVERFFDRMEALTESLCADPDQPLNRVRRSSSGPCAETRTSGTSTPRSSV